MHAMTKLILALVTFGLCTISSAYSRPSHAVQRHLPSLPLGLWHHLVDQEGLQARSTASEAAYPAHTLETPIDHFSFNDSSSAYHNKTFPLRYWYDATFYRPGGPVLVIEGGETSGEDRLPFMSQGILRILSEATNGLSVVLEHRYYGESWPVPDLSTDNLRFLTTHQAVADNAYFTQHARFPSLAKHEQEAVSKAKWIHYGGSYAGAKVAIVRKLYPDVVFGAIASSAVTAAITDYWKYFEGIRLHAEPRCVAAIEETVSLVDRILDLHSKHETQRLKDLFGLTNLTHIEDLVSLMTYPLGAWQARNWDPDVGSTGFEDFCDDLLRSDEAAGSTAQWPSERKQIPFGTAAKVGVSAHTYLENYARYIRENVVVFCKPSQGQTQDDCFGTYDRRSYEKHSLNQTWRSWTWQYCSEWGYLQNAPPAHVPSIISRRITLDYSHMICKLAFPDGKHSKVPDWPNTTIVNQYGGLDFEHDRVAFIDGSDDPWLYATPHSPDAKTRSSTDLRPYELINGGVHHWDENGLSNRSSLHREPDEIRRIHAREIDFVRAWLLSAKA